MYLPGANVADIKDRYSYRTEGKQDIKAFPFGPCILDEGEDESIDPCGRQGEDNVISRARGKPHGSAELIELVIAPYL